MGWFRKIRAGLVKQPRESFTGEDGNIFFDIDTGSFFLSDGVTPGGIPLGAGGSGVTTTDQLVEGVTNLFYTDDRVINVFNQEVVNAGYITLSSLSASGDLNYDNTTGTFSVTTYSSADFDADFSIKTADDLSEGILNQYYSDSKVDDRLSVLSIDSLGDVSLTSETDNDVLMYNSNTNSFVNTSINLYGGVANQVLVKKSDTDYDYVWEDMILQQPIYTKLIDDASTVNVTYLGEAVPESLESDFVWRIQKIVFDVYGNVDEVRFAAGGSFTQSWNDRLGLTYL